MARFKAAHSFLLVIIMAGVCCVPTLPMMLHCCEAKTAVHRREPVRRLSLGQAVAIALTRNFRLTVARIEVQKKEHDRRTAFSDFFPSLKLEYTATAERYQNLDTIEYLGLAQDSRWYERITASDYIIPSTPYRIDPYKNFNLTATLTQPLFSGGQLISEYKRAKLGVESARIQLDLEKQDLILDVHTAYYQLVLAYKLLETATKSVEALEAHKRQSEAFYRTGLALEVDVLSAQGQLAKARASRYSAEKAIESRRATLNFLLRYPQGTRTEVVPDVSYEPSRYQVPNIFRTAAANRLEIVKANISVQEAMAAIKKKQSDLMPNVYMEIEGSRTNDDWNVFDHEAYNDWSLQGVLTWTFDMFGRREKVKKKQADYAQKYVSQQLLVQQIMEEVQRAFIDMQRSERNIVEYKKALKAYLRNYERTTALYKEQLATYREVLDAETDAVNAAASYYTSLLNYKINLAKLERKMGTLR